MRWTFAVVSAAVFAVVGAFDKASNANMAVYYGQNSRNIVGAQANLAAYCEDSTLDIIPLAFLYIFFNSDGLPAINFAAACENTYFSGTGLLHCTQMGQDIKTCQAKGKKILLSLGGAAGAYGFTSDTQAATFADTLWNLFGGGTSSTRPFDDAIVDGFDLDIEGGSSSGYAAFVNRMRQHYAADTRREYYIAAAPQCPLPDAYLNTVLTTAHVDFIFVQFYNNYCTSWFYRLTTGGINQYVAGSTTNFNFAAWDTFAKTHSYNRAAKVYLGVPAAQSAAGTGYVSIETLGSAAQYLQKTYSSFGGIMMWDCSQAWANMVSGSINYAQQAKMYLASGAQVVVTSSKQSTSPATTKTLASTTGTLAAPGKGVTPLQCPAGCVPVSYSSTISIIPTPVSTSSSSPAAGCPVAGGSCASGAMACSGYYYGQCANGVWVMRKCADGLACFSSGGSVYCDWASNGVITNCGSSKVKRDTKDYGVAFVGGDDSSETPTDTTEVAVETTEIAAEATEASVETTAIAPDTTAISAESVPGMMNWLWGASSDVSSVDLVPTQTTEEATYVTESAEASTDTSSVYSKAVDELSSTDTTPAYTADSGAASVSSAVSQQATSLPYISNSTSSTNTTTSSSGVISDISSNGGTPPTNVSLSIQPLNTTHFLAVLQAVTLNNTPILTDWSFSFNSNYQITGADRGNLTKQDGTSVYTITSIPIQEPDRNMAIVVKLSGVYDSSTAEGMVGAKGVGFDSAAMVNGSYSLFKRNFDEFSKFFGR